MFRALPPLNALRAFEAAARHLSFTRAADELNVTQAAISHQVKALETHFGQPLFRRLPRRLLLTEAGQTLLPAVRDGFARIVEAAETVRRRDEARVLTVSLTPSFGGKWLAPRLARFWTAHPDIELHLQHSMQLVDFARDEVDLAVRWGRGGWPGVVQELLIAADLVPVCSPRLLDGPRPLATPDDLRRHTLLHQEDFQDWVEWLAAAGVDDIDARRGPVLNDFQVLLQTTVQGAGVALAPAPLVAEELADGRLVRPFAAAPETAFAYHLVYPPGALERPEARAFRDWLVAEARRDGAPGGARA